MLDSSPRRFVGRRQFLLGAAGLVAGGLAAGGVMLGKTALARPTKTSAALKIDVVTAVPTATLSADSVPQGGAFSVKLPMYFAAAATAVFNGQRIDLLPAGDQLLGLFAAGQPAGDETELDPGAYTLQIAAQDASGSAFAVMAPVTVSPTQFPEDAVDLPPELMALLAPAVQAQEAALLNQIYGPVSATQLWTGVMQQPLPGPITTSFGQARSYNGGPVSGHHSGVDLGAPMGAPVGAAAAGIVAFAGPLAVRGNFVAINHGLGVYTGYAHLSRITATVGATVALGEIIGNVGTTGLSSGPHLHWEVAVHAFNVDALRWTQNVLP
ncbi:MAG: M23 family metallopeptidase [Dehalococcoidia bacterium]